jgi:hypothetical protein
MEELKGSPRKANFYKKQNDIFVKHASENSNKIIYSAGLVQNATEPPPNITIKEYNIQKYWHTDECTDE